MVMVKKVISVRARCSLSAFIFMAALAVVAPIASREDGNRGGDRDRTLGSSQEGAAQKEVETELPMHPTGSSLPDCSHACGACTPCKRVMVSFKCSVAESCPVVYRCMCKGKYYHVPSK